MKIMKSGGKADRRCLALDGASHHGHQEIRCDGEKRLHSDCLEVLYALALASRLSDCSIVLLCLFGCIARKVDRHRNKALIVGNRDKPDAFEWAAAATATAAAAAE